MPSLASFRTFLDFSIVDTILQHLVGIRCQDLILHKLLFVSEFPSLATEGTSGQSFEGSSIENKTLERILIRCSCFKLITENCSCVLY